ncbi:MAG: ATP-binding protein, partial [Anaerolineae bacterium]
TTPLKILYVEDDVSSQTLVSRVLTAEGYRVLLASNGLEGIRMATAEFPALILMDINIGDLDGYEVTTKLRSIKDLQAVPIIALTANVLKGDKERALVAGCDGYISKPIDIDELPRQINAFLTGRRETVPPDEQVGYLTEYNQQLVEHLEQKVVELKEANQALQKLEKMKSDFIILSAHELRTPLTMVYGYARLLMATDPGASDVQHFAQKIFNSVSRLNEVVNDILNIALIQANKMELDIKLVSLETVVNSALIELDPLEKGRTLVINIDPPLTSLPHVEGDEDRLRQVFWNLLSNAIKFTPDGGAITVAGRADANHVYIHITDTGPGVPKEEQQQIFESFYVTTNTAYHTSSKVNFEGGGMGIGLSIVKGIVAAHQGDVWVESSGIPGKGATFITKLPITQPTPR